MARPVENGSVPPAETSSHPDEKEDLVEIVDDDDELTEEEEQALLESAAQIERGEGRPFDEFMRELMSRTDR
jgi:hypothetical protein